MKKYLKTILFLPIDYDTYINAAGVYRKLLKRGITIRNSIDCLIAAVAVEYHVPLLHNDRDFDQIERHCKLRTIKLTSGLGG